MEKRSSDVSSMKVDVPMDSIASFELPFERNESVTKILSVSDRISIELGIDLRVRCKVLCKVELRVCAK